MFPVTDGMVTTPAEYAEDVMSVPPILTVTVPRVLPESGVRVVVYATFFKDIKCLLLTDTFVRVNVIVAPSTICEEWVLQ